MTLKDLKTAIEYKNKVEAFIIFKYSDSNYIPHQYIQAMAKYLEVDVVNVESLEQFKPNASFLIDDPTIYVYETDTKLELKSDRYKDFKNLFIICKSIETKTKKNYEEFIIEIPKIEKWQKLDYIYFNCPTVAKELEYFADILDMYALDNEISKISIFSPNKLEVETASFDAKELPKYILQSLQADGSWDYLTTYTIFDFVKALLLNDKQTALKVYTTGIDLAPAALVQLLYTQIKDIFGVVFTKNATSESLGMPAGKYWAIRYSYANLNMDRLTEQLRFITDIDRQVKTGETQYDNQLLDLIMIKFLGE